MPRKYSLTKKFSTNVRTQEIKKRLFHLFMTLWRSLSPTTARNFFLKNFFAAYPMRLSESQQRLLNRGERFELHVHGRAITCWQWGQGPAIMLVHGWNGRGVIFEQTIDAIVSAGYTAIAFDAPGHGDSAGRTSSYFAFTDAIRALLNAEQGTDICGIIAHSLGGSAAINALSKEERRMNMVLIAPPLALTKVLVDTFNFYGIPQALFEDTIAYLEKRFGYRLADDEPYKLLERLQSNLLIIHDSDDPTVPILDSKKAAGTHDHVRLIATHGLGHKKIVADGEVVKSALAHLAADPGGNQQARPAASVPLVEQLELA